MKLFQSKFYRRCVILGVALLFIGVVVVVSVRFFGNRSKQVLRLTSKQQQEYYRVYQEPSVVFLRKTLNAYLAEDSETVCILNVAVGENRLTGIVSGLNAFPKDYYKSKFIVATISDNKTVPEAEGKDIQVIFQDKPDRIFYALVGKEPQKGKMCLLGFNSKEKVNAEEMRRDIEFFSPYLFDKEHAL